MDLGCIWALGAFDAHAYNACAVLEAFDAFDAHALDAYTMLHALNAFASLLPVAFG